jgi:hypothetical protein
VKNLQLTHLVLRLQCERKAPALTVMASDGKQTYTTNTIKAGADDEFNGNTFLCFDRPDGSMLASEGKKHLNHDLYWRLLTLHRRYEVASRRTVGFAQTSQLLVQALSDANLHDRECSIDLVLCASFHALICIRAMQSRMSI